MSQYFLLAKGQTIKINNDYALTLESYNNKLCAYGPMVCFWEG